ncbi:MAG TPA: hypothetical protein VGQ55_13070 [Pyrinomonadaceae bacterium]|jgi:hypothetical protein|nr:hypothetical protein [Pyrinomonadaceae bacterium]
MEIDSRSSAGQKLAFSSSVEADIWHPKSDPKSYEWWYFDALSDDGSEAIVIIFLDNYIYSPRYNNLRLTTSRFPAVSFTYFRDGKPLYKAVTEYPEAQFSASETIPECRIGTSGFKADSAAYGSGYLLSVSLPLSDDRRLEAKFEWLSIDSNLAAGKLDYKESPHSWNMAVPRADVTGRIEIKSKNGSVKDVRHFRGTGYHDHKTDDRWLANTVQDWHWGRAHFADSTAVFYRYREIGDDSPSTKLLVVKNNELRERDVRFEDQNYVRDKFGIRYPTRLQFVSEDNVRLRVKPIKVIDSSFYFLRFMSDITLTIRDGVPRKTKGITEFLAPKTLKYRWLNWLRAVQTRKRDKDPAVR